MKSKPHTVTGALRTPARIHQTPYDTLIMIRRAMNIASAWGRRASKCNRTVERKTHSRIEGRRGQGGTDCVQNKGARQPQRRGCTGADEITHTRHTHAHNEAETNELNGTIFHASIKQFLASRSAGAAALCLVAAPADRDAKNCLIDA